MSLQIITLIVGVIVAWLVLGLVLKVIKTSLKTAIILVLIFLALQFWGIRLPDIGQQLTQLTDIVLQFFENLIRRLSLRDEGVGFLFYLLTYLP